MCVCTCVYTYSHLFIFIYMGDFHHYPIFYKYKINF